MKEAVRQRARQLGFDECRITTAQPPQSAPHFQRWLAAGCHGEMAYLERNAQKRVEPQHVLPGARSVITLAASYFEGRQVGTPGSPLANSTSVVQFSRGVRTPRLAGDGRLGKASLPTKTPAGEDELASERQSAGVTLSSKGVIARYARYQDYHETLGPRLAQLADFVNELGGAGTRSLWYLDTGPLLERDLAQRAGLGFIGKHTNLISRRLGNWFFVAEILTTLELEPDAPEQNHCGSCTRCLAACPTRAITAPFQLDARLCISYLTIELKGPIPVPLRRAIGNRIYGCDDCLAACPWNRFAREGQLMKHHARPDLALPDLIELLALDQDGFRRRFAGTPMMRTKRRGLLRNVCVALGNIGDATALPALERAAQDPEPLIAEHARWAVEEIKGRCI